MPELPEVETIRRHLARHLAGRRIVRVRLPDPTVVEGDGGTFVERVTGRTVARLERRGKYLGLLLEGGGLVVLHLRMTGRLILRKSGEAGGGRARLELELDDGRVLAFEDVRRFGRVAYAPRAEEAPAGFRRLGLDALAPAFGAAALARLLGGSRRPVKAFLLDQRKLAGLGNIYADEALHRAGIHPRRPAGALTGEEVVRLARAIRGVLREALRHGGTTLRDYRRPDGSAGEQGPRLCVYGGAGTPCPRCGTPIVKERVGGRGTHFCPRCQPGPEVVPAAGEELGGPSRIDVE